MEIWVTVHKLTIATVFVQPFIALACLSSTHATWPAETMATITDFYALPISFQGQPVTTTAKQFTNRS